MQTLFAFHQCKRSDYEVALEKIHDEFALDLNSMEEQDSDELEKLKLEASEVFRNHIDKGADITAEDARVLESAQKASKYYEQSIKRDFNHLKKSMLSLAEGIEKIFLQILILPLEFAQIASQQENAKLDATRFVKNLLIDRLKYDKSLQKRILDSKISWGDQTEMVRKWYRELVKTDNEFVEYISKKDTSFADDHAIVNHLFRNVILKSELVNKHFEEEDINWEENFVVVKSMIKKLMKSISEEDENLELPELSYSWEEDKEFFEKLFVHAVEEEGFVEPLIADKLKNWDMERVAIVDKVILDLAVTELKNFPSIPVKVTINEYIEISKKYSTPKSKQFINGVLDVVAKDLQAQGLAKKSGRGLIDNK